MARAKKNETSSEIQIIKINEGRLTVCVLGRTPLIFNRMSEKVKQGLLLPRKKTAADKAANLKHDPLREYRDSMYIGEGPTLLQLPAVCFKRSMCSAATDIEGIQRAPMERLTWVVGQRVSVYGVPKLGMSVTRSADMNRTPDVRTRAFVEHWACKLTLAYMMPILNDTVIANLLAAAGMIRGVGDWRQEKGSGNFGQFQLVDPSNEEFKELIKTAGRAPQAKSYEDPEYYDDETEALMDWWHEEVKARGKQSHGNGSAQQLEA